MLILYSNITYDDIFESAYRIVVKKEKMSK